MAQRTLYLMMGYPGSGKTTTAQTIHELTGALHLWADEQRLKMFPAPTHSHEENLQLYDHLDKVADQLLSEGKSVIFDTNFNFYKDRQYLREIAAKHGAEVKLVWVQTPKDVAKGRATTRLRNNYTEHMPEADFERMSNNLQPPHDNEPHIAVDGTKVTLAYIKELLDHSDV